jgi:hypothetical protein
MWNSILSYTVKCILSAVRHAGSSRKLICADDISLILATSDIKQLKDHYSRVVEKKCGGFKQIP